MTWRASPEPLVVRATHHSHLLNPLFTPPMRRLLKRLGTASLAAVDLARVGPRPLETEASGSNLLGHYHSGIYRDSRLSRQSTMPRQKTGYSKRWSDRNRGSGGQPANFYHGLGKWPASQPISVTAEKSVLFSRRRFNSA